jgi:hypothetical protein
MTRDISVNQLATAVMWWLSYSSAVGRDYVLSESAIKFPVAEYLERSRTDSIELEFGHPKLSRKRFDLFFKNEKNEKNVFEFKYIKNNSTRSSDEKQRIFNDLMRLYLYLGNNKKHKGYFLICGNQLEFVSNFQTLILKPTGTNGNKFITPMFRSKPSKKKKAEGFYTKWFSFETDNSKSKKIIDIKNATGEYKTIYDNFMLEYKNPYKTKTNGKLKLPDNITTNLVFLSEDIKQQTGLYQPTKIGIWEIIKTI